MSDLKTVETRAAKAQAALEKAQADLDKAQQAADQLEVTIDQRYRETLEAYGDEYLDPDFLEGQNSAPPGSEWENPNHTGATANILRQLHGRVARDMAKAIRAGKHPYPVWVEYAAKVNEVLELDRFYLNVIEANIKAETTALQITRNTSSIDIARRNYDSGLYDRLASAWRYGKNSPEMVEARAFVRAAIDSNGGDSERLWETPEDHDAFLNRLGQYIAVRGSWQTPGLDKDVEVRPFAKVLQDALNRLAKEQNTAGTQIRELKAKARKLAEDLSKPAPKPLRLANYPSSSEVGAVEGPEKLTVPVRGPGFLGDEKYGDFLN